METDYFEIDVWVNRFYISDTIAVLIFIFASFSEEEEDITIYLPLLISAYLSEFLIFLATNQVVTF